ncbi:uncharacterized protein LOC128710937 [Anopheles marshallii]|uniref:uncharacterized protein LOC128710937 n=1 Tax=Anopheles marshallii TaxID=1521116 RepID=UPI00237ADE16|nr:uncharacterized protein LOC128710937 [Anopheles marshallii]
MKLLVLSVLLCALVATSTAQSSVRSQMQSALGSMLGIMREMSLTNKALISNADDQIALNTAYTALDDLYSLFSVFGSNNSAGLPLPSRTKLNSEFPPFQNAVAGWENALDTRTPDGLSSAFKAIENAFLRLAGVVVSL